MRDQQPELFKRIKRLPLKARSTRSRPDRFLETCQVSPPALLSYLRQGQLDKFYLASPSASESAELDFFAAAKTLRPADPVEKRENIPPDFYTLLDQNKRAFEQATSPEQDDAIPKHRGSANDAYILKRLKAREIKRYHGFTDEDETFIRDVMQLLTDGALPSPTTKKVAEALKTEIDPLRALAILRRDIPPQFFQATRAQQAAQQVSARQVILSSYVL